jgi:hypothetical protein
MQVSQNSLKIAHSLNVHFLTFSLFR